MSRKKEVARVQPYEVCIGIRGVKPFKDGGARVSGFGSAVVTIRVRDIFYGIRFVLEENRACCVFV